MKKNVMWNSVISNLLCSESVEPRTRSFTTSVTELLRFVPLIGLFLCLPAWLGLPASWLPGWPCLGGLAWVVLVWPACWVAREAWLARLAWVPVAWVAWVAWVHKTRSIYEKGMRQGMRWHALVCAKSICHFHPWLAWLAGLAWLAVLAWPGSVAWL